MGTLFENHHAGSLTSERPAFVLNAFMWVLFLGGEEHEVLTATVSFLSFSPLSSTDTWRASL